MVANKSMARLTFCITNEVISYYFLGLLHPELEAQYYFHARLKGNILIRRRRTCYNPTL